MYGKVGSNVTFPIVVYLPNKTLRLQWANDMEECLCPPSDSITQCECNINTHSLPHASYSDVDNTIYFANLPITLKYTLFIQWICQGT